MFIIYLLGILVCLITSLIFLYLLVIRDFTTKEAQIECFSELITLPVIFSITSWFGFVSLWIWAILYNIWHIINKPIKKYWYKLLNKIF